ncbi:DUF2125 domain-containing protein [Mesorhizobium sp. NBSH29]|uniref:DUF2125 domain-containing protein n=1 Tax=Mesorhizobium sp. NBSH29 TaxID=2654249 RepID=UPI00189655C7|nr:DUF2125 domain-containing protein [Mesorhizobium sp. NBSH29]QPC85678.1 DUF2125 domain-containing protein [Mesorhizobium sp. NBSH29]
MTPADTKAAPSTSRRFMYLAAFILLLIAGYSAGWYYLAGKLTERTKAVVAALNHDGVTAECGNMTVRGYPFRLGVYCDTIAYHGAGENDLFATLGGLRTAAQVYDPLKIVAEVNGPLRTRIPGKTQIWLDWDNLRGSARIARPLPQRISLEASGLSAQTDPDDGDPVMLFSAGKAEAHLRPSGADVDVAGSFSELQIDADTVGGRTLPVLAGTFDGTLANGVALVQARQKSLRGQSGTVRDLGISLDADTGISVSGTFTVAEDGLLDADLKIAMRNPKGFANALAVAAPEFASQINSGIAGLAFLGGAPELPLKIVKGRAVLGFIPLGAIPPLL